MIDLPKQNISPSPKGPVRDGTGPAFRKVGTMKDVHKKLIDELAEILAASSSLSKREIQPTLKSVFDVGIAEGKLLAHEETSRDLEKTLRK